MTKLSQNLILEPASPNALSPYVFGCNLEHTRACLNGGLSAQMLKNRKFAGKPSKNEGCAADWFAIGAKNSFYRLFMQYYLPDTESYTYTKHIDNSKMPRINEEQSQIIQNLKEGALCGIGQRDLSIQRGKTYELRLVAKANVPVVLHVCLTDRKGDTVYAQTQISLPACDSDWNTFEFTLTPDQTDAEACLRFTWTEYARIFFGAVSMLPQGHFLGMRPDVIAHLKEMGVSMLRWPGGNFAGEYRWRDGLLPVDMRAPLQSFMEIETNPYTHGYDFHEIGTDEFIALCREIGAEPFITINPVWNSPEENAAWVEYCNGSADTEYGKIRAERGFPEPYQVKFWSLGNEMGYGHMEGEKTPEAYARLARKQAQALLAADPTLQLCSSGPYPQPDWIQNSANTLTDVAQYVSLHHYANFDLDYSSPEAIRRTCCDIFDSPAQFQGLIHKMRETLDSGIHISFDEWNRWYAWYRPSSAAEGIFAAQMLHMFFRESIVNDVPVCCYFQPVGEGAIQITPDSSFLTGIGQAFSLMSAHKGGNFCEVDGITSYEAAATVRGNLLTVTLINTDQDSEKEFRIDCSKLLSDTGAACAKLVSAQLLTPDSLLPHGRFDSSELAASVSGASLTAELVPCSIAKICLQLC